MCLLFPEIQCKIKEPKNTPIYKCPKTLIMLQIYQFLSYVEYFSLSMEGDGLVVKDPILN